jgi:hypothetical protein
MIGDGGSYDAYVDTAIDLWFARNGGVHDLNAAYDSGFNSSNRIIQLIELNTWRIYSPCLKNCERTAAFNAAIPQQNQSQSQEHGL